MCVQAVAKDASVDKWIAQLWLRERAYAPTAPPGTSHAAAEGPIAAYRRELGWDT